MALFAEIVSFFECSTENSGGLDMDIYKRKRIVVHVYPVLNNRIVEQILVPENVIS